MTPTRLFTTPLPTMSATSPILSPTITPEDEEDDPFDFQLSIVAVIIISGVAGIVLLLCIGITCLCVRGRR